MKYVILKKNGKFLVYKADDDGAPVGQPLGSFDDEAAAQAEVKKLRAEADTDDGEDEADEEADAEGSDENARGQKDYWPSSDRPTKTDPAVLFSQAETRYTLYAVRQNPANAVCQTCRFFIARRNLDGSFIRHECAVTESYPLEIVPTGYCTQWTKRPLTQMEAEAEHPPLEVVIVDAPSEPEAETREKSADDTEGRTLGRYPSAKALQVEGVAISGAMFKVLDGGRFVAVWTNNARDHHREILTEKAIDAYVARVKAGMVPLPVLTHWHIVKWNEDGTLDRKGGAVYGEAEWVERIGHFGVAVGKFHDTPLGRAAQKAFSKAAPGEFTMSHGFFTRPDKKDKNGLIHAFNTFEISTLPAGFEANPLTSFFAVKEKVMPLTAEKKASLVKLFGAEGAAPIIADLQAVEEASKTLDQAGGLEFKDLNDPTPDAPDTQDDSGSADETALKDLFGDLVKDAGALASGLVAEQKARRALDTRLKRLEDAFEMDPVPVGEGDPVNDKKERKASKDAKTELKDKQKIETKAHPYATAFPGAYEGVPDGE